MTPACSTLAVAAAGGTASYVDADHQELISYEVCSYALPETPVGGDVETLFDGE